MNRKHIIKISLLVSLLNLGCLFADDAQDFNIVPDSPLNPEFFNKDIPAEVIAENISYESDRKHKPDVQFAIINDFPDSKLGDNEVYIKKIKPQKNKVQPPAISSDNNTISEFTEEIYPAAGTFVDDNGEAIIPENLVSIDDSQQLQESADFNNSAADIKNTPGEFIAPDAECITAETDPKDKFSALPNGTFTFGYQMQYMNYNENGSYNETILNGLAVNYNHKLIEDLELRLSGNIMGGKVFSQDRGAVYSETEVTLGKNFSFPEYSLTITPYAGIGLRYLNNIYAGNNIKSRNTLQLYLPVGISLDYRPDRKYSIFTTLETGVIALNQNWTDLADGSDSTTTSFSGINIEARTGVEFNLLNTTLGLSPYYKYIFTGSKSSSPVGEVNIHAAGINAWLKF